MRWHAAGTIFLCLMATTAYAEEFVLPPNDGFITDPGDVIPLVEEEELEKKMLEELKQTGVEFVSVILPTLAGRDIAHLAWELRTKWGLQQNGNGILLLIAREEGKTLIAPGKKHEQVLTDTVLADMIETDILPPLRQREYVTAVEKWVSAVRKHLRSEDRGKIQKSGLPIKKTRYPVGIFLLILLACSVWARIRRQKPGPKRHKRQ